MVAYAKLCSCQTQEPLLLSNSLVRSPNYKWWVFSAVALGTFASVINHGSVNVALPTIAEHFGTDLPTVQWVVVAEMLTISALLLPMGRLSDLIGRKPVYVTGLALFGGAAAFAGFSDSITLLVVAKMIQGCGAAMTQGTGMAMITSVFPEHERGKGIGSSMSVVGVGAMIGPVIGGILVGALGWRWVFFINVPIGIIAIAMALLIMDSKRFSQDTQGAHFDWLGTALSTAALVTFLMLVTNGHRAGWTSAPILLGSLAFPAILATFVWWELRAPAPMLDLRLFKNKVFALGVLAGFMSYLGPNSVRFMMPFYLQGVLGMRPSMVGLAILPAAVTMIVMGPLAGRLSDRFGWRKFTVSGLLLAATGVFALSRLTVDSSLVHVIGAMVVQSVGSAMFSSPNSTAIFNAAPASRHGIVSALLSLIRNAANVTGVAVATTIIAATMISMGYAPDLGDTKAADSAGLLSAFVSGFRLTYMTMAGLLLVGAVAALVTARTSEPAESEPASAREASPAD
jgi:EmrB/QacA subfamily drug resistance transporter